jgi:transcriptional regulator with XRE-family HTH domain
MFVASAGCVELQYGCLHAKALPPEVPPKKFQKSFQCVKLILRKTSSEVNPMANGPSYARWSLEPYSIGMKLRTLRTQKHLTLSRLAVETGLSTALLSKLETDRMIPTLPTLSNICRVYGVGLSYFFTEAAKHTLAITRKAHFAGNGRGQEVLKQIPLHAVTTDAKIVARMVEYPPGVTGMMSEAGRSICSVVYVLEGTLQLDAGGMHETLEEGDCVYIDTDMAIAWSAGAAKRCRALVITPGNHA